MAMALARGSSVAAVEITAGRGKVHALGRRRTHLLPAIHPRTRVCMGCIRSPNDLWGRFLRLSASQCPWMPHQLCFGCSGMGLRVFSAKILSAVRRHCERSSGTFLQGAIRRGSGLAPFPRGHGDRSQGGSDQGDLP